MVIIAMLLGMTLAASPTWGISPPAADIVSSPSSFWYYANGEKVSLPLATDEVVVRFAADPIPRDKEAIVAAAGNLAPLADGIELPVPELTLIKTRAGLSEAELLQTLDDLLADPGVAFAYPVFAFPDARMTLTDQFVAQFKPDTSAEAVAAFNAANGVEVVEAMRLPNTYILRVGTGADTLAMANLYHESELTTYATPDFVRFLNRQFTPNDPLYPNQWGMENAGTNPPDGIGTADADIDASAAWDIEFGDPDIVIAIIDVGVELNHEDLDDKIVAHYSAIPGDTNGGNPNNTWDAHGTNCAGIATAETNNNQGVAGVCANCSLMAVQIAYSSYDAGPLVTNDSWIANAMIWAVDHEADVLSNSWGGGSPSTLINAAITHAVTNGRGELGSAVLFAAGNGNSSPVSYPALNNLTIAVGATSPCDERKNPYSCDDEWWWGSNYGADLDVVAPGVEWWTTDMMGTAGYGPGNYFDHMNGTSSATPTAAGLAGLILSYRPCLTEAQVQEIMEQSAEDQVGLPGEDVSGWDQYMGWGRINAHEALLLAENYPCEVPTCVNRVLFDETHGLSAGFTIEGSYSELAALLESNGHIVDSLQDPDPFDYATISQYDVLVLVLPIEFYSSAEKAAIAQFVEEGGRLVTISEFGGYVGIERDILNDVHAHLGDGLFHNDDMVIDPTDFDGGNDFWPIIHNFSPDAVNDGVGAIVELAGSSLQVIGPAYGTAFGDSDTYVVPSAAARADSSPGLTSMPETPTAPEQAAASLSDLPHAGGPGLAAPGDVIENFVNAWQDSAIGLVYNPSFDIMVYAHESGPDPTVYGVDYSVPHDMTGYCSLSASNPGWPVTLDNRDGAGYDAALGTYFLPDYNGDLDIADDNIVEMDGACAILNAWETDGASNDSYDGSIIEYVIDIAVVPGSPTRYFVAAAHDGSVVYEIDLIKSGQFVPDTWGTVGTCTVPDLSDNMGIDFDAANELLYHSDFNTTNIVVTDLDCNVVETFTCDSPAGFNTGVTFVEGKWPPEIWVTDFGSNSTTRCEAVGQPPGEVIVQAMSNVGAGDVFAIGDGDLWVNTDDDGDGTITLYEYDNAQLALNVFALGGECAGGCPVALFKDNDPWGGLAAMGADSQSSASAVAPADETLLDATGDLTQETQPEAPVVPLDLGDVVNEFSAPTTGFIGLEWIAGYLWVSSAEDEMLYRLDPTDGTVLQTISIPGLKPTGLAWDGSAFWITDSWVDTIWKVDMSGTVLDSFPAPAGGPVGLAWDGSYLWDVDFEADELHQIDPNTGAVLWTIPAPDTRAAGVAWDGQGLWTNGRDSAMTFKIDPYDGSVLAAFGTPPGPGANNGRGGAFDGQYLWVANRDVNMIYQIDVLTVPSDPNEQIMQAWGVPYDVFGSSDIGAVDLSPYCKVIVASQQPFAFYDTLSANRAWFEGWIAGGGMLEFHGAAYYYDDWSGLPMPGGFTMVWDTQNDVTILDHTHPIVNEPNPIADPELDNWGFATHGYLIDLPPGSNNIIAHEPTGEPATAEFGLGAGCVVVTDQSLEWGWMHEYSPILENFILYDECQAPVTPKCILLVDDDDNNPDVRPYYEDALNALGYDYDVFEVPEDGDGDGPQAELMANYNIVIWFSGHDYAGPNANDEAVLAAYLDGGGHLWLVSQDYLWNVGLTPFGADYLHIGSYVSDVGQTVVEGANAFAGLGPYVLSYPFTNYSDEVIPDGMSELAFAGDVAPAAIEYANQSVFFGFPWEAIADPGDRIDVMTTAIAYLGGCGDEPILEVWPETCEVTLPPGESTVQTLEISNVGGAVLDYSISEAPDVTWLWEDPSSGAVPAGDTAFVDIGFDASGLGMGTYATDLVIDHNDGPPNPYILPCTLNVAACTTVFIEPEETVTYVGNTFTVEVWIADVEDLGGFEFDLHYDPSVVWVVDVVLGDFPESTGRTWIELGVNIDNVNGMTEYGAGSFGAQPGPDGTGVIAVITLQAIGEGSSAIDLDAVQVTDPGGVLIEPLCMLDGFVEVSVCDPLHDADFGWDDPVRTGRSTTFSGMVGGGTPPFDFTWDFGDGSGDVGEVVEHTYDHAVADLHSVLVQMDVANECSADHAEHQVQVWLFFDFDLDCDVDIVDIMSVAVRWSCEVGEPCYNSYYDVEPDGDIDILDIMQAAAWWSWTCP